MKTNLVLALSFLAVFALLPVSLLETAVAFVVIGLLWIVSLDYAVRPLPALANPRAIRFVAAVPGEFKQAA